MGIADSMKGITENIVASYDVRVNALEYLVSDTHKTIKGFAADRKKMSEGQAKKLADFVNALTKNVGVMLKGFQTSHNEMSEEQAKNLAVFVKSIAKDVAAQLKGFQTDREKMSEELKESLGKAVKEIESYAKKRLKEFNSAHAEMSDALKKSLAKYVAGIVSETKKLLGGFADEREKMAANWQALTATMAKRRGGKPVVSAGAEVKTVEEVVEEEEVPAEPGMEERVLEFIEGHPEGVKISDMEESLGVSRTRLGKIAKRLLGEGKVRREENLYFPL